MLSRIFSPRAYSTASAAALLGVLGIASKLSGVLRDRVLAHYFGAGDVLDAYYAAFRIPDLLFNLLIVGALSAGFIPVFLSVRAKDHAAAWRVTNIIANILGLVAIALGAVLFLASPLLMPIVAPGFSGEKLSLSIALTRIMCLSPVLFGLSSIAGGVLQSLRSFLPYAIAPILYNAGIMIGAAAFVPFSGPAGLAYGVLLGATLHLFVQLPALLKHGYRYEPVVSWRDPAVANMLRLMGPRTLGLAATHLNLVAITMIASTLGVGSIAIFTFAHNLDTAPVGIIGVSFAIAAFPALSELAAQKRMDAMTAHLSHAIRQILFFIVPATILFLLLRAQIVRVALGSGAFDWAATRATVNALAFFSLSLFAQCLIPILARAFYAMEDTWTPFVVGVISALVNIIACLLLKDRFGVVGLALGFSLSMLIQMALLWIVLRVRLRTLHELSILQSLYKISAAGILMGLAIQILKTPLAAMVDMTKFWGIFLQGAVAGSIGIALYGAVCYALRLDEMRECYASVRRRFWKTARVPGEIEQI